MAAGNALFSPMQAIPILTLSVESDRTQAGSSLLRKLIAGIEVLLF
jgi:hypothetical protein